MKILIIVTSMLISSMAFADTWVNGYTRKNGTQVQGHYRSDSNSTKRDNWSTRGNINPYTGQKGYKTYNNNYNGGNKKKYGY